MRIKLTTRDLAVISICSALYAVVGILTAPLTFLGIGFLPAVVIPAVFAALFGPWVGGISGALGIFIRDMVVHGNPALSLVAGVPANFILFFLIGYIYTKNINLKQALICVSFVAAGMLIVSIVLLSDMTAFTGLSTLVFLLTFILTIITSLTVITVVSIRWKAWSSYVIGAIIGQIAGGLLLSVTVWAISPLFIGYFGAPIDAIYVLPLFIWTIATEIPFILLIGPIFIKFGQMVFPTFQRRNKSTKKGETID